jgi:pimeloyl-ACP methyl ester carboxylesterase
MNLRPFEVHIPQSALNELRDRVVRTRWAPEPGGGDWALGVPGRWLREVAEYWADGFDWRAQETAMNRFEHYRVSLDEVPLHFVHVRGNGPSPMPLVLTHGWPWTFWDFAKVIAPLTDPAAYGGEAADSFDVIVPSLPGFVFSSPLHRADIGRVETAALWFRLMRDVLGYDRFGAQGGDWGAFVSAQLAHEHADYVIGAHLSFPALLTADIGGLIDGLTRDDYAEDEKGWFDQRDPTLRNQTHFFTHIYEPQTIAWAMHDSPVGLAAWMLHRRRNWSDCGGDVERCFTRDELLTHLSLYWLTDTFSTSVHYYAASIGRPWFPAHDRQPALDAPTGIAVFPRELVHVPRAIAAAYANLVHWTVMPRGGHFAPSEQPDLLVEDIRAFFRPLR